MSRTERTKMLKHCCLQVVSPWLTLTLFFPPFALTASVSTYSAKYLNIYKMDWSESSAQYFARAVVVSRWRSPMTMPWLSLHATTRFTVLVFTCWSVCWLVCQRDYTKTTMNIHETRVLAQNRTHLLLVQTWINGEIEECLDFSRISVDVINEYNLICA